MQGFNISKDLLMQIRISAMVTLRTAKAKPQLLKKRRKKGQQMD